MPSFRHLFLFIALILIGCENSHDLNGMRNQLTLSEGINILASSIVKNDLITKIDSGKGLFTIHFESGEQVIFPSESVERTRFDSVNWLATFHFRDNSVQTANFVGELEFDDDDIVVNPYLTSPLTALAEIQTPVKGRFKISVKGKVAGGVDIAKSFDYFGMTHRMPVLGLHENYANEVEFVFLNAADRPRCSKTIILQTAPDERKPSPEIEIVSSQLSDEYRGLYIISNLKTGFDQRGETRWYYKGDGMLFGKLRNGNLVISDTSGRNFSEVTMLGKTVRKYQVPNGLHHEIFEMPDGNFLVPSYSPPGPPYEDRVVEISRSTGAVTRSWDFNGILDPFRKSLPNTQSGDWLHINALYYDDTDQSIVISGRSQCAVVKIDYLTGAIKWILSNHKEWKESFAPYLLKSVNSLGEPIDVDQEDFWSYGQHAIHRLQNGNLLLYDNGDHRGFYDDPNASPNSYTRMAEYKINEQENTVELVWDFDYNKSLFTRFTGYAQDLGRTRLAAYMFVSQHTPRIVEVNTNNEVIYEATINRGKASYYRAFKLDVYGGLK